MAILSYEGCAGRTTLALNLSIQAALLENLPVQLAGFDIEKPDLMHIEGFQHKAQEKIFAQLPVISISKCSYCGVCAGFCKQKAIQFNRYVPSVSLDVSRCDSCGSCLKACSRNGIKMLQKLSGFLIEGSLSGVNYIGGQLQEFSNFHLPLIKALLERLNPDATVLCDFGPGNGKSVKVGLRGMDMALVVARPTHYWERNLEIMLELLKDEGVPVMVVLNNVPAASTIAEDIIEYCSTNYISVAGKIPVISYPAQINAGLPLSIIPDDSFKEIWRNVAKMVSFSGSYETILKNK